MKLTKAQEEVLMVLIALEGYRKNKRWDNENLWEVSCELALDEGGYDLREKVKDLRALSDTGMIKFDYDEDLEIEEGEEYLYNQIAGIWLLDRGRNYIVRLDEPLLKRLAGEAWDNIKNWLERANINIDSLFKVEIKTGDISGIKIQK